MQHKCKMTVLDKKHYPELQARYCADPESGPCPCYRVGDAYVFERYGAADDFWHMGAGTLANASGPQEGIAGSAGVPHCSEAWDAVSRYIYTALQGGSIMQGWMKDERVMIACCSDGTRPVVFKLQRLDYKILYIDGIDRRREKLSAALTALPGVTEVQFRPDFAEVYLDSDPGDEALKQAVESCGCAVTRID